MSPPRPVLDEVENASRLVVLIHAYMLSARSLNAVVKTVRSAPGFEHADILRPDLPMGMFSSGSLNPLARAVLGMIDEQLERRAYKEIYLVGHSVGGLLARKVYVVAFGQTADAPFEPEFATEKRRRWAVDVQRIVLLAGMNRGWRITHHLSITKAIGMTIGVLLGRILEMVTGKKLLIFQIRRGAPFLTQLRLQWIAMTNSQKKDPQLGNAVTVQLLGSVDDVVSPEDNIDLVAGSEFIYLDVGYSTHANVIEMADPQDGPGRSETFIKALTSPSEELKKETVQVADFRECPSDESIKEAIFVVHGIRDPGYWTQKIARRVAKLAGKDRPFAMVTSSYGYFPMAPFLVASSRRKKVEWLMDQYAEAKARYPNAKFSCVAHSNGTYLIAKALELYPACRFRRIVFAGSVLRQSFKWRPFFEPKNDPRVLAVTNYVATGDWVVAFFPKFFQFLHWQDLGSAGHDGFDDDPDGAVYDQRYVQGGHSAALDERNWDAIARFIVTGERPVVPEKLRGEKPVPWIRWAGIFPPAVWILLIGIVAVMGYYLNRAGGAALLVIYLLLIWKVLTRI